LVRVGMVDLLFKPPGSARFLPCFFSASCIGVSLDFGRLYQCPVGAIVPSPTLAERRASAMEPSGTPTGSLGRPTTIR
jgi:hypothetical protein